MAVKVAGLVLLGWEGFKQQQVCVYCKPLGGCANEQVRSKVFERIACCKWHSEVISNTSSRSFYLKRRISRLSDAHLTNGSAYSEYGLAERIAIYREERLARRTERALCM